jgi:hypothetical protein
MGKVGRRRATVALGATLLASAAFAAIAVAATTRLVFDQTTQSPNAKADAKATCPAGRWLVGGGFGLDPAYDPISGTGAQTLVQQSFPTTRRAWKVRSFASFGGTDSTLYSVGLCRRGKFTRESNAFPIAPVSELTVLAKCARAKWHIIGGGFRVSPAYDPSAGTGANVSVNESRRLNDVYWRVRAIRDGGAGDAHVRAYVLCERDSKGRIYDRRASVAAEDVGRYTATARCRGQMKVVSGGFKVRPLGTPGSAMSTGLFPWVSVSAPLPNKDGWTATIHNSIGPVPGGKLTVWAYCKNP